MSLQCLCVFLCRVAPKVNNLQTRHLQAIRFHFPSNQIILKFYELWFWEESNLLWSLKNSNLLKFRNIIHFYHISAWSVGYFCFFKWIKVFFFLFKMMVRAPRWAFLSDFYTYRHLDIAKFKIIQNFTNSLILYQQQIKIISISHYLSYKLQGKKSSAYGLTVALSAYLFCF